MSGGSETIGATHEGPRVGILGGGQLAQMLASAAMSQGCRVVVLARQPDDPAAIEGVEVVLGSLDDPAALDALMARVDVVTIENELLELPCIAAVAEAHPGVQLRPALAGIAVAQDKLAQKRAFAQLGIAAAAFEQVSAASLSADLTQARARFPTGFVLKWSRYGYDGRGNLMVAAGDEPPWAEVQRFVDAGEAAGAVVFAEQRIDFSMELAMVSTRADDGDQASFPLVVSRQERGICREVYGPATRFGVDARLEHEARHVLEQLGAALGLCGSFAVEFFLTRDGRLLVNEMAPRVHNSGHYTLFEGAVSQFDLHIQAVTGQPLSAPDQRGLAAMRNILGPLDLAVDTACARPSHPLPPGTELVWYHKRSASPGRKLGHLTGRAESVAELERMLTAMDDYEQQLWARQPEQDP